MTHDYLNERIEEGDETLITIPVIDHPISLHEWHAVILCGSVGFICGERDIGLNTLRREPWYALGAFVLAYLLGRHYDPALHARLPTE